MECSMESSPLEVGITFHISNLVCSFLLTVINSWIIISLMDVVFLYVVMRPNHLLICPTSLKPFPSSVDVTNKPVKLVYGLSPSLYRHHLGRSVFLRSHLHHGHHYPRRTSRSRTDSFGSLRKTAGPVLDEELPFKSTNLSNSESGYYTESKAFGRPERIRCTSSALMMDWTSSDAEEMVCEMCRNPLLEKFPCGSGSTVAYTDPSVVAILACGHIFHAECLEERTPEVDKCNPPCSLCTELQKPWMAEAATGI